MNISLPKFLLPNERVSRHVIGIIALGWVGAVLLFWTFINLDPMPNSIEALSQFGPQWQGGLGAQLLTSLLLSLESIAWAVGIGLFLCYLSTVAFFRPLVALIGKLRFLSLTGVMVVFYMATNDGHSLKVAVLTFAILTFLINDMLQVIEDIPRSRYDYARTMGLNRFGVLWQVVIRGTLAQAFDAIRMNAAIAWMMLTAVEGLSRTEGGVGVLLYNLGRMNNYEAAFTVQLCILLVGLAQDYAFKYAKNLCCPYARS